MITQLTAGIPLAVSSLLFIAGAYLFIQSKKNKIKYGIDIGEFISSQYMLADVPFGASITKKLLLRRLGMDDFASLGEMPNWLAMFLKGDIKEIADAKQELDKKTDAELIDETKKYYDLCQKIAERSIVRWAEYVKEWQSVDPEYTGRLGRETLDFIFNAQMAPVSKYIKKKMAYSVLLALQKANAERPTSSEKNTTRDS